MRAVRAVPVVRVVGVVGVVGLSLVVCVCAGDSPYAYGQEGASLSGTPDGPALTLDAALSEALAKNPDHPSAPIRGGASTSGAGGGVHGADAGGADLAVAARQPEPRGHEHVHAQHHTTGFDGVAAAVREWTPQRAAEMTGVSPDAIEQAAHLYAGAERAMTLHAESSITRRASRTAWA